MTNPLKSGLPILVYISSRGFDSLVGIADVNRLKGDRMLKIGELKITPINKEPFTVFGTYQVVNGIYYVRGVSYPKEIVEEVEVING